MLSQSPLSFGGSGQLGLLHLFECVADLQGTVENTDSSQTSKKSKTLRGFAFGKFCQVTQADAILGIFLHRFSKSLFSNILMVSNIA